MNVNRDAHLIETTGLLDAALTGENPKGLSVKDIKHVASMVVELDQTALKEGRSVRINGDLVTISLDAYKQLSANAERVRWRKVSEEPPPNMEILATYAKSGARTIWAPGEAPLGPDDLWRPLD